MSIATHPFCYSELHTENPAAARAIAERFAAARGDVRGVGRVHERERGAQVDPVEEGRLERELEPEDARRREVLGAAHALRVLDELDEIPGMGRVREESGGERERERRLPTRAVLEGRRGLGIEIGVAEREAGVAVPLEEARQP